MAVAHMPPPCGSNNRTCSCRAVVAGSEVRCVSSPPLDVALLKILGSSSKQFRPYISCKKPRKWRRTGTRNAWLVSRGISAGQSRGADESTLTEMATLANDLLKLNELVNEGYKGIGPDIRGRVDNLYNRATLLKQSADRMVAGDGRMSVQLTATLKALQREHASVENIVRLAMKAGPVITDNEDSPSKVNRTSKEVEVGTSRLGISNVQKPCLNVALKENEGNNAPLFESLILQSSVETADEPTTSGTQKYVMSTPAAKDSSPLAAFRKEIERRVMEQLVETRSTTDSTLPSEKVEGSLEQRDAVSASDSLEQLIQNFRRDERRARRRERAVKGEAQSAESYIGDVVNLEVQPETIQVTHDPSSLADLQKSLGVDGSESTSEPKELGRLRSDLSDLEQHLLSAKEASTRAARAEAQLQKLTEEMTATVPLDVHNQMVKLEREVLQGARIKIAQVTADLKEKEAMLAAIKQEMMAEQEKLVEKVRELSGELSTRISAEEVEAAVTRAVHELESELENALKRAESMRHELETNEKLLMQLRQEWDMERNTLREELALVKEKLAGLQKEQAADKARLSEAMEKVNGLEDSVCKLQQAMLEAEEERQNREENVLATVRSLVADMVKTRRAKARNSIMDSSLIEAMESIRADNGVHLNGSKARQMNSVEGVLGSLFSGEKALALETFFVIMAVLIQKESEKLETTELQEEKGGNRPGLHEHGNGQPEQDSRDMGSSQGQLATTTKPVITLYYESSWESAYLHYSADNSRWTELPGVCMHSGVIVNNTPLKVINVEGSSLEFVLTDGRGSWDCAPNGGNYHIRKSGTFLLSSGFIEQKR